MLPWTLGGGGTLDSRTSKYCFVSILERDKWVKIKLAPSRAEMLHANRQIDNCQTQKVMLIAKLGTTGFVLMEVSLV